jgi:zinc protease
MNVIPVQAGTGDVCGVHLLLKIGPERIPSAKAGLRALTQQVILNRMREQMKANADLADLVMEGSQGARFSVTTQPDGAEYVLSVSTGRLGRVLSFLADSVFRGEFTEDDLLNAAELLDEGEGSIGGTGQGALQALELCRRALLGPSPLADPIFGTGESRGRLTLTDLKGYWRAYYVPNLASLAIVGPMAPAQMVEAANAAFGTLRGREVSKPADLPPPPEESRVETGSSPDTQAATVVIAVPLGPVTETNHAVAEVIYGLLSGPMGRIQKDRSLSLGFSLPERIGSGESNTAGVLPISLERAFFLAVFARCAPTALEDVRAGLLGHLLRLAKEPVSAEELKRAKLRALNLHALAYETPAGAATIINRAAALGLDYTRPSDHARRIEAVTADQILQFAKANFTRHGIGVSLPGD